jgi:serpin B
MKRGLLLFVLFLPLLAGAAPIDTGALASAINTLGLDLYRVQPGEGNLLLSPYSIQVALAMTYAGADGETRAEMQRVLHYPTDENALDTCFAELSRQLAQIAERSAQRAEVEKKYGRDATPIEFHLANRLFVQRGFELRASFLDQVKNSYGAEPKELDFAGAPEAARLTINQWAEDNTKGKIRDLIPPGTDLRSILLALANAVYLRAPWRTPFEISATKPESFFVRVNEPVSVPTMRKQASFGYKHYDGFTALALPYAGDGLQFLILLPDKRDGLAVLESKATPALLAECAKLSSSEVVLSLPKFKLEPPSIALSDQFQQLGMKTTFRPSANFDRMAAGGLYITQVFHKAFLALDEKGTEAAAATVVFMARGVVKRPQPIEVHVDHPFIFAIQHVPSGECLFLGRVTDPR